MNKQQEKSYIRWFTDLSNQDVEIVGGKNASLGEMIAVLDQEDINVPDGFATTAEAYWKFLKDNNLQAKIKSQIDDLENAQESLETVGAKKRI